MVRYYLHVHSGKSEIKDTEGMDLPDLEAAHMEAITRIRSLLIYEASRGRLGLRGWISVTDAAGKMLLSIPFRAVVIVPSTG
jgi:hypothetical protein